jgi:hypothetical protein
MAIFKEDFVFLMVRKYTNTKPNITHALWSNESWIYLTKLARGVHLTSSGREGGSRVGLLGKGPLLPHRA